MKKIISVGLLLVAVFFLSGCNKSTEKNKDAENKKITQEQKNDDSKTEIYLVKTKELKEVGNGQVPADINNTNFRETDICSGEIMGIKIDGKLSPKEVLEKLFTYPDDSSKGVYNAFSKSKNIKIDKLDIKNNFAIVTLAGDFQSDNSSCSGRLMHDQIVKTLSQFDNIAGADIFVGQEEITGYLEKLNRGK